MLYHFIQAAAQDLEYLLELRKLTMVKHLETSGLILSDEEHRFRLNDAYEGLHLIVYKETLIGALKFRELEEKTEIMQLQIHPIFQGNGLGRKILEQFLDVSQPKYRELTVLKENPAINLYRRLGFTMFGEDRFEYFMHTKH